MVNFYTEYYDPNFLVLPIFISFSRNRLKLIKLSGMLIGYNSVIQALFGSLFTWAVTALGASFVFLFKSENKKLLDGSLGFAAGVMTAASFWSLLAPALEITEEKYDKLAFLPVSLGFIAGAGFVYVADRLLSYFGIHQNIGQQFAEQETKRYSEDGGFNNNNKTICKDKLSSHANLHNSDDVALRKRRTSGGGGGGGGGGNKLKESSCKEKNNQTVSYTFDTWRRVFLMIVAVTVHNIPEGLAVGVGFGAVGKSASATFQSARNLALGIGIQNFPEGFAVSLPLVGLGYSKLRSFWYGQLSGMVEPVSAVFGAVAVQFMEPVLPYSLAFAAGAMIYVVVDDIIPEAQMHGNGKLASWSAVAGFVVMMSLDVGLG